MRYWRGILYSESFDEHFNGKNLLSLCLVNGNLLPNQLEGLVHGRERICYRLNVDLISLDVSPGAHPCGKWCEGDCLFTGLDWVKVCICYAFLTVIVPVMPILLPSPGSFCSDSISNWSPRKHEITRDATFAGILYSFHQWFWGRGKWELK